jgi:hypothetical protein
MGPRNSDLADLEEFDDTRRSAGREKRGRGARTKVSNVYRMESIGEVKDELNGTSGLPINVLGGTNTRYHLPFPGGVYMRSQRKLDEDASD